MHTPQPPLLRPCTLTLDQPIATITIQLQVVPITRTKALPMLLLATAACKVVVG
jgi:hypothetical protein